MSRKRKWAWGAVGLVIIALLSAAADLYFKYDAGRHESIHVLIPADIDRDGQDEVVVYYNPHRKWSEDASLLEALETSGERLWSIMTVPAQWAAHPTRQDLLVARDILVVFSARYVGKGRCGSHREIIVAGHASSDGEQLWQHSYREETDAPPLWSIIADDENIYTSAAVCGKDGTPRMRITALKIASGKPAWKADLPVQSTARPISAPRALLLWKDKGWIINKRDGNAQGLPSTGPFRVGAKQIYVFDQDESGEHLNTVDLKASRLRRVMVDEEHLSWAKEVRAHDGIFGSEAVFVPTRSMALYDVTSYRHRDRSSRIEAIDAFKPDWVTSSMWADRAWMHAPHLVVDHYTLCFLYDSAERFRQKANWRLAILDTKTRRISWRSKRIAAKQRRSNAYHYRLGDKEVFLLDLLANAGTPIGCMLVFDREAGQFINAVKISDEEGPLDADAIGWKLLPWQRSGGWLYGAREGRWWRVKIDAPIGESAAGYKFSSCFGDMENSLNNLGKIPRARQRASMAQLRVP